MKREKEKKDELRPEYRREDLGPGIRGKYLDAYLEDTLENLMEQVTEDNLHVEVDNESANGNEEC
jgi:hypothetical protein